MLYEVITDALQPPEIAEQRRSALGLADETLQGAIVAPGRGRCPAARGGIDEEGALVERAGVQNGGLRRDEAGAGAKDRQPQPADLV